MNLNDIPLALTYDDVLLVPQRSAVTSRNLISLKTKITPTLEINFPIIATNMDTITGVKMANTISEFGGISLYPRFTDIDTQIADLKQILESGHKTIPSVGVKETEYERLKKIYELGIRTVVIDIAHGHLETCLNIVKKFKTEFKDLEIIAGNVGTYEASRDLFEAGACCIKVGIGPGTICTTRKVTGSGMPQITAICEARRAADEFGLYILGDGGAKTSGDVIKGFAAGADAFVTGNMLSGTDECPGDIIEINGQEYKSYNGSTSKAEKHRQIENNKKDKTKEYASYVEGVESFVPYKGSVIRILDMLDKGIRSGLSYSGAFNIQEFHKKARFVRVTTISANENGAHGVIVKN